MSVKFFFDKLTFAYILKKCEDIWHSYERTRIKYIKYIKYTKYTFSHNNDVERKNERKKGREKQRLW